MKFFCEKCGKEILGCPICGGGSGWEGGACHKCWGYEASVYEATNDVCSQCLQPKGE